MNGLKTIPDFNLLNKKPPPLRMMEAKRKNRRFYIDDLMISGLRLVL